jgi:glycine cleavage system transcriptional repressor
MTQRDEGRSRLIITTIGVDRPGIVAEISGWILEHGGNIEDSRMSQLGSEFATLILVSGPADIEGRLEATRGEFERSHNLNVSTKPVSAAPSAGATPMLRYALLATSLDHPGIVHQVAQLLRTQSVNIVSATTQTAPAPFTGAPVFQVDMEIDIPSFVSIPGLRAQLNELGMRENIDFTLKPVRGE